MRKNLFERLANMAEGAIIQIAGKVVQYKNNEYCMYRNGSFIGKSMFITYAYDFMRGGKA